MQFLFFSFFLGLSLTTLQAQQSEKLIRKADTRYADQLYEKALDIYRKAEKKTGYREDLYIQIARCHEQLSDYSRAEAYFAEVFYKSESVEPVLFLEYADVLMKNGKNEQARSYLTSYNNLMENNDLRVLKNLESIEDYNKYFNDSAFIDLNHADYSSEGNEMNPVLYRQKLYFVSNIRNLGRTPTEYDIYSIHPGSGGATKEHIKVKNFPKGRFDGFTIASSTGEFIFTVYDFETESSSLYRAFISDTGDDISKPEKLSLGSFNGNIAALTVNPNGNVLIFASDAKRGIGGWDLYRTTRSSYGYNEPELIGGFVNTLADEKNPYLFNDSVLFFVSNGQGGVGGYDIFYSNLNTPTALPVNAGYPVNSRYDEYGLVISEGGLTGFLVSDRSPENTYGDLYNFQVLKIRAWGVVTDKQTGQNLKKVAVDVIGESTGGSQFLLADNGSFSITGKPGELYKLSIWKEGYRLQEYEVTTSGTATFGLIDMSLGELPIEKTEQPVATPEMFTLDDTQEVPISEKSLPAEGPEPKVSVADAKDTPPEQSGEILFRVQIAASRIPLKDWQLRHIYSGSRSIFMFREDKWYKYAIGEFDSYFEANRVRKECGVEGAFVAAYRKGSKIPLKKAIEENAEKNVPKPTRVPEEDRVEKITVYFAVNSLAPVEEEKQKLDRLLQLLKEDKTLHVSIEGHSDTRGNAAYNLSLAGERANHISKYLVSNGIEAARIHITSFGEELSEKTCGEECSPSEHRLNRKAEIILFR